MKIAIVAGSHRREAESARVASYLEHELNKLGINDTYMLSLSGNRPEGVSLRDVSKGNFHADGRAL